MKLEEINVGDTVWVKLDEEDMYGAESDADDVIQARVIGVNPAHDDVEVVELYGDEEFLVETGQCHRTEAEARLDATDRGQQ